MIKNFFKSQLASVIEWKDQSPDVLWYKFPSQKDEIKNASKLIVAPGQGCILVYEGKVVDVLTIPNVYVLDTDNHPFITSLLKVRQLFESEHKVKIYFFRSAAVLNQSWGTDSSIKYMDDSYKIPIQLGMNGNFSYQIAQPQYFFENIVAAKDEFTTADMKPIIVDRFVDQLRSLFAQQKYAYNTIDAVLTVVSAQLVQGLKPEFEALGLLITDFNITGTIFDEETEKRIGNIADVSADVQAAEVAGMTYQDKEKLKALRDAARNEGGLAGMGAQLGVGMEIGKLFTQEKDKAIQNIQGVNDDIIEKLRKLKILLEENIIDLTEFDALKKQLLNKI